MAGSLRDQAGSLRLPPIAAPPIERAMERLPPAFSQAPGAFCQTPCSFSQAKGTAGIVWKTALRRVLPIYGLDNGERIVPVVGTVVRAGPAARDGRVRAGPTKTPEVGWFRCKASNPDTKS